MNGNDDGICVCERLIVGCIVGYAGKVVGIGAETSIVLYLQCICLYIQL